MTEAKCYAHAQRRFVEQTKEVKISRVGFDFIPFVAKMVVLKRNSVGQIYYKGLEEYVRG